MKRKLILALGIVVFLLGAGLLYRHVQRLEPEAEPVGSFRLEEYNFYLSYCPTTEIIGAVKNTEQLKRSSLELWREALGAERANEDLDIRLYYDDRNAVWLLKGRLRQNPEKGEPGILISAVDGRVLALWHNR